MEQWIVGVRVGAKWSYVNKVRDGQYNEFRLTEEREAAERFVLLRVAIGWGDRLCDAEDFPDDVDEVRIFKV